MYLSTVFHYACQNNLSFAPNKAASTAVLLLMTWQTFLTSRISQQEMPCDLALTVHFNRVGI